MEKAYYAVIPASVRYDKDLTANAKLLYGEITALCNEKGYCWASNEYFADLYSTSTRTVSRWIKQLISKRYITSKLIYKNGSKEIEQRNLYLGYICVDKNDNTYRQKCHEGIDKNVLTPIDKNVADNNTVINNTINNNIYSRVVDYLNKKANKNFKHTNKKTQSLIKARLNENFTEEDFIRVIDIKTSHWLNDEKMEQYLRPETLFSNKFESYLNAKEGVKIEYNKTTNKHSGPNSKKTKSIFDDFLKSL